MIKISLFTLLNGLGGNLHQTQNWHRLSNFAKENTLPRFRWCSRMSQSILYILYIMLCWWARNRFTRSELASTVTLYIISARVIYNTSSAFSQPRLAISALRDHYIWATSPKFRALVISQLPFGVALPSASSKMACSSLCVAIKIDRSSQSTMTKKCVLNW